MSPSQENWRGVISLVLAVGLIAVLLVIAVGFAFNGFKLTGTVGYAAVIAGVVGAIAAYLGVTWSRQNGG